MARESVSTCTPRIAGGFSSTILAINCTFVQQLCRLDVETIAPGSNGGHQSAETRLPGRVPQLNQSIISWRALRGA
jgi:hypothetical protein